MKASSLYDVVLPVLCCAVWCGHVLLQYLHAWQRGRQLDVQKAAYELISARYSTQLSLVQIPKYSDHSVIFIAVEERHNQSIFLVNNSTYWVH